MLVFCNVAVARQSQSVKKKGFFESVSEGGMRESYGTFCSGTTLRYCFLDFAFGYWSRYHHSIS
jgi:hypothetical protein